MKYKKNISKVKEQKSISKERIKKLFDQADKVSKKSTSLANRYVTLARKISMKTRTRIPTELKRKFCKHCYKYFSAKNSRTRIHKHTIIRYCENCKKYTRMPLKQKKYK